MDELIPNNGEIINHNENVNVGEILFNLPLKEYDIVMYAAQGIPAEMISNILLNVEEDEDDDEFESIMGDVEELNEITLTERIKLFLGQPNVKRIVSVLKENFNNKKLRQAYMQNITFSIYSELFRKSKKGDFKEMSPVQLTTLAEKMMKTLHLEEQQNKEDIKDGIQIFQEIKKMKGIRPIISEGEDYDIYDEKFFQKEPANKRQYKEIDDILGETDG